MSDNYCRRCGNRIGVGDNHCPNCGKSTGGLFTYTPPDSRATTAGLNMQRRMKNCPECGGSGRVSTDQSSNGVVTTTLTLGIGCLLNHILSDGKWKCEKCDGTGEVPA